MGYWKTEFDKIALNAVNNYAAHYQSHVKKTGFVIVLTSRGEAEFLTKVNGKIVEKVKFLHIYHGLKARIDLTGMTYLIPKFIAKTMMRLAQRCSLDPIIMNLEIRQDDGVVYIALFDGTTLVKLFGEDELFDDEQIAADQLEEQIS